jgi:cell volume regulation protein A
MTDVEPFGVAILLVAVALLVAVVSNRLSERIHVPAPALFLVAAAVVSDQFPALASFPVKTDERLVTVALIFILFDGGMQIGWHRFREVVGISLWMGVVGTIVTAAAVGAAAHLLFGFDWLPALLLGTALAPTDPAMVFSVLGNREISGRSGTILKGEAGANDPVGIALMVVLLGASGASGLQAVGSGVLTFVVQMVVGAAVGAVGGYLLVQFMRRVPLPNAALYPVRTMASAAVIYGAAAVLHGSGFLAVLLAGIIVGDERAPYKHEIERFASGLGSVSEIVAFTVLGLTIDLHDVLTSDVLWIGLALGALLILLIRPVLVGLLIAPARLARGERAFVLLAGLKGAVPVLLGLFALGAGTSQGSRVYGVVFVVVLVSAVGVGGFLPALARALKVPMRTVELEPWALGMRFRSEPDGLHRHVVAPGSPAEGTRISDLALGEDSWISMVSRRGHLVEVHGDTAFEAGDEVLAIGDASADLGRLFDAQEPGQQA